MTKYFNIIVTKSQTVPKYFHQPTQRKKKRKKEKKPIQILLGSNSNITNGNLLTSYIKDGRRHLN